MSPRRTKLTDFQPLQREVLELRAEVERLVREKADLEMDRGMLKAVHGALVDAGCRMGKIGKCEADLVRGLSSEVERLRAALAQSEKTSERIARVVGAGPALRGEGEK